MAVSYKKLWKLLIDKDMTKTQMRKESVIIEAAQDTAFCTVNVALLQRNWLLGKHIAEEELSGNREEDYGLEIIKNLSKQLNQKYGKGFIKTNLDHFL